MSFQSIPMSPTLELYAPLKAAGSVPPLRALLFADFDNERGRRIVCQVPENVIDADTFYDIQNYLIPKNELWDKLVTLNLERFTIIGYPIGLSSNEYHRNLFQCNMCFVLSSGNTASTLYEPLVKKLANYLRALEVEQGFLSSTKKREEDLPKLMSDILEDINKQRSCRIQVTKSPKVTIYLKIAPLPINTPEARDFDVPFLTQTLPNNAFRAITVSDTTITPPSLQVIAPDSDDGPAPLFLTEDDPFDVATRQLLPYFNGYYHVAKIAELAAVDIAVVRSAVRNLAFYGLIVLLPVFQYGNRYALTGAISRLYEEQDEQLHARLFVQLTNTRTGLLPNFSDILTLFCSFQPGLCVKDWCLRLNPRQLLVDERRLVQYGVWKGYLRKISGYPIQTDKDSSSSVRSTPPPFYRGNVIPPEYDGSHAIEEFATRMNITQENFVQQFEAKGSNCVMLWK